MPQVLLMPSSERGGEALGAVDALGEGHSPRGEASGPAW